ncbi:MAG: tryptophan synthase, alpha subunit [Vampirovibrio sp.]|nr:tryptophan synthase, alpha subunit [Vampirovibrio sp.]
MSSRTTLQNNRYARMFSQLGEDTSKAFIPFTILGWPDRDTSLQMIKTMINSGAHALELGLAFSDPMADGVIIQEADKETLANGFKVKDALALLKEIRRYNDEIPIGLLVYYNMVLARGIDRFFQELGEAGVDGVLIADLPVENMQEVAEAAKANHIQLICIVSPLTTNERLQKISEYAGGFLYVVSRLGITGVEENFDASLRDLMTRLKSHTQLPLCVGFGISKPEHAQQMIQAGADGVIIGSRIIQMVKETAPEARMAQVQRFIETMVNACG